MNSNFRWFVVALTATAFLPVRAQAQVQNSTVRGGNRVTSVQGARPARARNVAAAPSFHGPFMQSVNHRAFNARRFQNFNGARRFGSMGIGPRPAFRPPQCFVGYNLRNQRPAAASGAMNVNIATTQIANGNPTSQSTRNNQQLTQVNNPNRVSGSARNHVFTHRSGKWHSDWDYNHDHLWHGHLCHFAHNTWIVYDVGFYPWWYYEYPYDYGYAPDSFDSNDPLPSEYDPNESSYGYSSAGANYSDGGDYDQSQDENQGDGQDESQSENQSDDSSSANRDIAAETVSAAQDELAREGYYHGPIDGAFSRDTHRAVSDFQKDNGLNVTGYLSRETRNALELDEDETK